MLPHSGQAREAPVAGEIFRQPDLAATLRKLVEAEAARAEGRQVAQGSAAGGLRPLLPRRHRRRNSCAARASKARQVTQDDLANWRVKLEEPRHTSYRGIDVYKLDRWTQGPAMLQALNILENFDLKAMGYNSARYIHTVYQAMSLAFADRDFYYGDPYFPPEEPIQGLLSKDYAKAARGAREAGRRQRSRDRARRPVSVPGRHESLCRTS